MENNETFQSGILPQENNILLGHEYAEKILLDAWKNNSLHNSWLISGIEGIGKATLAYRFARFLKKIVILLLMFLKAQKLLGLWLEMLILI